MPETPTAPTVTAEQIAACASDNLIGQFFDADKGLVLVTTETTGATITGTVETEVEDGDTPEVHATWYAVVTLGPPPGPDVSI